MPFGLSNAPATFQRLMEKVLSKMNWIECLVYIDDVLVWASTFENHLDKFRRICNAFRVAGLKVKMSKCQIVPRQVKYLGHLLGAEGLIMDPDRKKQLKKFAFHIIKQTCNRSWGLSIIIGDFYLRCSV